MYKARRAVLCIGTAMALAAMGACGSDSSDNSADSNPADANSPVVIGTVGSYSGAQASSLGGVKPAIEAWAEQVNANGGLAGHPVELRVVDDQENPAVAVTEVKKLIEQENVAAIVADVSNTDTSWAEIASNAKVPVVGGQPNYPPFATNPYFFPSGGGLAALAYGAVETTKEFGTRFASVYCAEAPGCKGVSDIQEELAEGLGVEAVYSAGVSASAADYTAVCQAIKSSGAQSVVLALNSATIIKMWGECQQQGVTAMPILVSTATQLLVSDPVMSDFMSVDSNFPFEDSSTPATQEFQEAIDQYAPDITEQMGTIVAYAWAGTQLLEAAVEASGSNEVTRESILEGLYSLPEGENLGGLAPPLGFTEGADKPPVIPCWFVWGHEDGELVTPNGVEAQCGPEELLTELQDRIYGGG
jgi:branched-chain amino acid transport system substrate-binding protein